MSLHRSLLLLGASALLAACAPSAEKQMLDLKHANTRALEQRRMNAIELNSDQGLSARGAEISVYDPDKTFDPRSARFGHANVINTKAAQTTNFNFDSHVQTREFVTPSNRVFTKNAWMGDVKFETKAAPVRESWFSRLTARTPKTFETKKSPFGDKTVATRPTVIEDKPFLVKGRRQADFDTKGPAAQAMGGDRDTGQSWSGDLRALTIDDVKKLLNKN